MKFGILSLLDHYVEDKSEEQYYQDFFDEVVYAERWKARSMRPGSGWAPISNR